MQKSAIAGCQSPYAHRLVLHLQLARTFPDPSTLLVSCDAPIALVLHLQLA